MRCAGCMSVLGALFLSVTTPASADVDGVHGRLELQDAGAFARGDSLDTALDAKNRNDFIGNLRLTWEPTWENWSLSFHYVVAFDDGDGARLQRAESALLLPPPSTWFNLTERFANHAQVTASQKIDRLSIAYTTPHLVVRIGRQALTWGSGLLFRPMDLFDPFSSNATDTEYKPGTDMLYVQWLLADGSDVQFIVVPRPTKAGAQPSANASSIALHLHTNILEHETTALIARDHGDWVAAIGVNGALGGATWNVEFVPTFLDHGGTRASGIANVSYATTLLDRNASMFAEYFHNGFGVGGDKFSFATLPSDLADRLARGQLFNTRRDYLAAGLTLEVDPLLNVSPTLIAQVNDASLFALLSATRSLTDNLALVGGVQTPIGPARSEFGGLPLAPGGGTVIAPPLLVYIQLRRYF